MPMKKTRDTSSKRQGVISGIEILKKNYEAEKKQSHGPLMYELP